VPLIPAVGSIRFPPFFDVPAWAPSDILDEARAIHISTGRPVAILLAWRLGEMDPARLHRESYVWTCAAPGAALNPRLSES
jgi:hypothetical protein